MQHIFLVALVLTLLRCGTASKLFVERSTPLPLPQGWTEVENADENEMVHLTVALKQENVDLMKALLKQVSDPRSPKYGHYFTNDEITSLVNVPQTRIENVRRWLVKNGANSEDISLSKNRDFISAKFRVKHVQRMLGITMSKFEHFSGQTTIRSLHPYSVPTSLRDDIAFVGGIHRFPNLFHRKSPIFRGPRNDPIISYFVPGDQELSLFLGIRCSDGNFAIPDAACSNGQYFTGIRAQLQYDDISTKTEIPVSALVCRACSEWDGVYAEKCNTTIGIFKANATALFCQHSIEDVRNFFTYDAPNFVAISLTLTSLYSSSSSDSYTFPGKIILSPWITPQKLQSFYGIEVGHTNKVSGNSQAVAEFLEQYYDPVDLKNFFISMGQKPEKVSQLIGPNDPTQPGGEASLDIQYIMGVARNVSTEFWSVPGRNPADQEPFLLWLQILEGTDNPPLVHSVSYADLEFQLSADYITRVENEFVKAGLRGISILFASGDDGCGGYLLRDNATACATAFSPGWPSSSPHVTTVGGTQLLTGILPFCSSKNCDEVGEVVSSSLTGSRITSGGGFSNFFGIPDYQADAVNEWLQNGNVPPLSFFNSSGRAYPDISGIAHNYLVQLSGELIGVDGTSASTPLVAAIITLLNEIRLRNSQPVLGFLNPWIYQTASTNPEAFNDIVVGENGCSANPSNCCPYSFSAAPGWDPVTGVGSPKFNVLKNLLPK